MKPKQKRLLARKKQKEVVDSAAPEVVEEVAHPQPVSEPEVKIEEKKSGAKMPRGK